MGVDVARQRKNDHPRSRRPRRLPDRLQVSSIWKGQARTACRVRILSRRAGRSTSRSKDSLKHPGRTFFSSPRPKVIFIHFERKRERLCGPVIVSSIFTKLTFFCTKPIPFEIRNTRIRDFQIDRSKKLKSAGGEFFIFSDIKLFLMLCFFYQR